MLALEPGAQVLDATVGLGGHAEAMLERIGPGGRLIGLDRDQAALAQSKKRLERYERQIRWGQGHFGNLDQILGQWSLAPLDAVLFDLGVSSMQLDQADRGFSFRREGPLDMRMNPEDSLTAAEIVNHASQRDLEEILRSYGEERWAGRITRAVVRARPLRSTTHLAEVVRRAIPGGAREARSDPATRTFQAIRIAVNQELDLLPVGLAQAANRLKVSGRLAVLSYHSLEDRVVKCFFREQDKAGILETLTPKPVRPSAAEVSRNPRCRSACLRAARRR